MNKNYIISAQLAGAIGTYLAQRPYAEVAALIAEMNRMKDADAEKASADDAKEKGQVKPDTAC